MKTLIISFGLAVVIYLVFRLRDSVADPSGYQRIAPAEVKKRLDAGEKVFLLDVRTPEEYAEKHIPKSLSLPLDQLAREAFKRIPDKKTPVFVYCVSGARSARAAGILVKLGYSHVYDMGAMRNWPGSMHKFDISQKRKLDNPERRRIMPPEETLRKLGLKTGDIMADVGCGIGYFTFPAGQIVGPEGKVLAMDVADEMLNEINEGKERNQVTNIETVKVTEDNLPLKNGAVNFALVCNVLHEIEEFDRYIGELQRILAVKGRLAVIDFEKKESQWGPPIHHRIDKNELIGIFKKHGLKVVDCQSIGEEHYSILAENDVQ